MEPSSLTESIPVHECPNFKLSEIELRALSAYLSVQGAKEKTRDRPSGRPAALVSAKDQDIADRGKAKFNQMFCVTCHALAVDRGGETTLIGGDIGPELTKVGSKVKPDWLVAWLRNPEGIFEHTRMPRYEWSDSDLQEVSRFILDRLTDPDLLKDVPQLGVPTPQEMELGKRLFVEKGCAECHVIQGVVPRPNFGPDLSALGMLGGPFLVEINSDAHHARPSSFCEW